MKKVWEALALVVAVVVAIRVGAFLLDGVLPDLFIIAGLLLILSYLFRSHKRSRLW